MARSDWLVSRFQFNQLSEVSLLWGCLSVCPRFCSGKAFQALVSSARLMPAPRQHQTSAHRRPEYHHHRRLFVKLFVQTATACPEFV